jgi:uncharacterized protein
MMLVKTKIGPSSIHGTGIFADEDIPAGTAVWKFSPEVDRRHSQKEMDALSGAAREHMARYAYLSRMSGLYVFCSDNGKYFNHSDRPNTSSGPEDGEEEVVTRAKRDIRKGEELTADYRDFEKRESYFSPKCEVRAAKIGKGIFAKETVRKDEVVLDFSTGPGKYLSTKEAAAYEKKGNHFIIQVEDESYLVATEGPERVDFINHSCEPNCGIRGRLTVVAMRDIEAGEEITFDYAMTESWPWYKMVCLCGTAACRHIVTGRDWSSPAIQRKYKGYFSGYIARKMDRNILHGLARRIGRRMPAGLRALFVKGKG